MYKEYEIKAKCYKTEDCYLVAGGIKLSWRGRNLGKSTGEGGGGFGYHAAKYTTILDQF